jgi:hypothetical protein
VSEVEVWKKVELLSTRTIELHASLVELEQGIEGLLRDLLGHQQVVEIRLGLDGDEDLVLDCRCGSRSQCNQTR